MVLLYIIGFFVLLGIVGWIIEKASKSLETRRYKVKLNKLAPQLNKINTQELRKRLSELATAHSSFIELLGDKYKIGKEKEQVKTIEQYVREEANYRRSKRKPTKRTYRRKYWGHRRYY